jgi:hypothetical protein
MKVSKGQIRIFSNNHNNSSRAQGALEQQLKLLSYEVRPEVDPLPGRHKLMDDSDINNEDGYECAHGFQPQGLIDPSFFQPADWNGRFFRKTRFDDEIDFIREYTTPPNVTNPLANVQMDKIGRTFVNVATQVYGLVSTTDRRYRHLLVGIHGVLMALGLDSTVYSWIVKDIWGVMLGNSVRPESLEDFGEALGKDAVKYITDNLTKIVESIVKFCSAALIAPSLMQSKAVYFKNIGHVLDKARLSSMSAAAVTTEGVVSMLAHCVSRAVEHLVNWTFPDEVNQVLRESVLLRDRANENLKVLTRDIRDHLVIDLQGMAARLTTLHLKMRGDKFTVAQALLKELDLVIKLRNTVSKHAIDSKRVQVPISINIIGEPAIGKSEIINVMMHIIASVKRTGPNAGPYQPHEVCDAPLSKYFNGLTNDTKVIIFDDLNAVARQGEKADCVAARWAEFLIQLINNHGFKPELAQADMKGTVQPHCDAVISTSNVENQNGNMAGMNNLHAVARRFAKVFAELKPQFMTDGKLDVSKVAAAGNSIYEINPWKLSYRQFNLQKAREIKHSNPSSSGIENSLWEHVTFEYQGRQVSSDNMTFDMFRELFRQQVNAETNAGEAIKKMDNAAIALLFPGHAVAQEIEAVATPTVDPEVFFQQKGKASNAVIEVCRGEWYLSKMLNMCCGGNWFTQLTLITFSPFTSVWWLLLNMSYWRPPSWTPDRHNRLGFFAYCKDRVDAMVLTYKMSVLCLGYSMATGSVPIFKWLIESMGLDLREVFLTVMYGANCIGEMRDSPSVAYAKLCQALRDGATWTLWELAKKERQARLRRVLCKGILTGVALGTLVKAAKWFLNFRNIVSCGLDERLGANPVSSAQSTVNVDGVPDVDVDYKVDAAPRHRVFQGTYATMRKKSLANPIATQTPEDARKKIARSMYRMTIVPCTGAQLENLERSEYKSDMYVIGYSKSATGTYMVTVAHAFAREYSHFCITVHDYPRKAKEYVLSKKDIVFAPRHNHQGVQHDIDLCMFELPRSILGDMPVMHEHLVDVELEAGTNLVRLVPTCDLDKRIVSIDMQGADYVGIKSFTYTAGTPAASLLPSPVALWITGEGDNGLCGSVIMSGGAVVAMHTGSYREKHCITASPLPAKLLISMRARLISGKSGAVPSYGLDDMRVCAPYLDEYTKTGLVIDPDVSVVDPGALSPALWDGYYSFVGTLKKKDGLAVNVKAKTSISVSPYVDMLMDYIPDVPRLLSGFGIPSKHHKMHATIGAFVDKSLIPRPGDSHLEGLAKQKVGLALYSACSKIVLDHPGFGRMKPLNMQGALDGIASEVTDARFNMGNRMPMSTSIGVSFPGVKSDYMSKVYAPEHDKHFICFHDYDEVSMEIRDSVYDIIDRRKAGDVGLILNFICPKDEVLPIKSDGHTKPSRHICKIDVAHIIVIRMYFQPVLVLLGYDPLSCGHSVGLDPTMNYLEMMKSLVNGDVDRPLYGQDVRDSRFIATDYSGFDLSLSGSLLAAVMDILINLTNLLDYTDEDRRVMSSVAYDLCNPRVVMLGTIVQLAGVNTSGNPLTTIINCVANMLINCQIHAMIRFDALHDKYMTDYPRDYSSMTVSDMEFDLRRIVTYGDDVVVRVDNGSLVDQPATIYYGKQLGYVITGSDKGDSVTKYAKDFAFLKRKYNLYIRPSDDQVVLCLAPLALDSIYKPFVWGDFKKVDISDYYTGLVKSALHELVQHGRSVYDIQAQSLWAFVQSFVIETKGKKGGITFRTGIVSRFRNGVPSWEDAVRERYGSDINRIEGELTLSELELLEL